MSVEYNKVQYYSMHQTKPVRRELHSKYYTYTLRMHANYTVEDHGCSGKGRHATQTTIQHFSRPMPLLLLYHAPSFHSLCTEGCARTIRSTCVGVHNVKLCVNLIYMDRSYSTVHASSDMCFWCILYLSTTYVSTYHISSNRGLPQLKAG